MRCETEKQFGFIFVTTVEIEKAGRELRGFVKARLGRMIEQAMQIVIPQERIAGSRPFGEEMVEQPITAEQLQRHLAEIREVEQPPTYYYPDAQKTEVRTNRGLVTWQEIEGCDPGKDDHTAIIINGTEIWLGGKKLTADEVSRIQMGAILYAENGTPEYIVAETPIPDDEASRQMKVGESYEESVERREREQRDKEFAEHHDQLIADAEAVREWVPGCGDSREVEIDCLGPDEYEVTWTWARMTITARYRTDALISAATHQHIIGEGQLGHVPSAPDVMTGLREIDIWSGVVSWSVEFRKRTKNWEMPRIDYRSFA
jgi:hypothetical protein